MTGNTIYCPEGEKDVDTLGQHGLPAFTFGGSSDVPEGCEEFVQGRDVVVLADNDDPGRRWVDKISSLFATTAVRVRVVHFPELPERSDVSDWFEGGGTVAALLERAASARPLELASPTNATATLPLAKPLLPGQILISPSWVPAVGERRYFPQTYFGAFGTIGTRLLPPEYRHPKIMWPVALLASAGAALANVRWPIAGAAWSEPPVLWCGLVGAPSAGKESSHRCRVQVCPACRRPYGCGIFIILNRDYETRKHIAEAKREAWKAEVKTRL